MQSNKADVTNITVTDIIQSTASMLVEHSIEVSLYSANLSETTQLPSLSGDSAEEMNRKRVRRQLIAQEIHETEKGYINDMNNIVRNFLDPLNSAYLASVSATAAKTDTVKATDIVQNTTFGNENNGWLSFDQKQAIIRNAAPLLRQQKLLAKLLEDAVKTNSPPGSAGAVIESPNQLSNSEVDESTASLVNQVAFDPSVYLIAKAFISMIQKLESVYIPYCTMHDNAMETWNQIREANPHQSQRFLDECRLKMNSKLDVQDFLIKPVQRIMKYPLLLGELQKSTPTGTPEYNELSDALEKIKNLVATINEKKRIIENDRKRDNFIYTLHAGGAYTQSLQNLSLLYGFDFEHDSHKNFPIGFKIPEKFGHIIHGNGIQLIEYEDVDSNEQALLIKSVNFMGQPSEINYVGGFLFQDVLLIIWPKRPNSFYVIHIIPFGDVKAIKEVGGATNEGSRMKMAIRISWEVPSTGLFNKSSLLRTIDIGSKSEKEKILWLEALEKTLPEGLVAKIVSNPVKRERVGSSQNVIINAHNRKQSIGDKDMANIKEIMNLLDSNENLNETFLEVPQKDIIAVDAKMADFFVSFSKNAHNHKPQNSITPSAANISPASSVTLSVAPVDSVSSNSSISANKMKARSLLSLMAMINTGSQPSLTRGSKNYLNRSRSTSKKDTVHSEDSTKRKLRPKLQSYFGGIGVGSSSTSNTEENKINADDASVHSGSSMVNLSNKISISRRHRSISGQSISELPGGGDDQEDILSQSGTIRNVSKRTYANGEEKKSWSSNISFKMGLSKKSNGGLEDSRADSKNNMYDTESIAESVETNTAGRIFNALSRNFTKPKHKRSNESKSTSSSHESLAKAGIFSSGKGSKNSSQDFVNSLNIKAMNKPLPNTPAPLAASEEIEVEEESKEMVDLSTLNSGDNLKNTSILADSTDQLVNTMETMWTEKLGRVETAFNHTQLLIHDTTVQHVELVEKHEVLKSAPSDTIELSNILIKQSEIQLDDSPLDSRPPSASAKTNTSDPKFQEAVPPNSPGPAPSLMRRPGLRFGKNKNKNHQPKAESNPDERRGNAETKSVPLGDKNPTDNNLHLNLTIIPQSNSIGTLENGPLESASSEASKGSVESAKNADSRSIINNRSQLNSIEELESVSSPMNLTDSMNASRYELSPPHSPSLSRNRNNDSETVSEVIPMLMNNTLTDPTPSPKYFSPVNPDSSIPTANRPLISRPARPRPNVITRRESEPVTSAASSIYSESPVVSTTSSQVSSPMGPSVEYLAAKAPVPPDGVNEKRNSVRAKLYRNNASKSPVE